jgi:formylglycine-generating enzyme required for sulfatase activity
MSAQVSRADLLRALHLGRDDALVLEHTDAIWWGYVPPLRHAQQPAAQAPMAIQLPVVEARPTADRTTTLAPKARSALRMLEVWVAERVTPENVERSDDASAEPLAQRAPLRPEEIQPPDAPSVSYQDLVPLPRLVRPLSTELRQARPGAIDVQALLRASARRRWPRNPPRRAWAAWPQSLVVLLDVSPQLFPYRRDMNRLVGLLRGLVPKMQLKFLAGWDGPQGRWEPWEGDAAAQDDVALQPQSGQTYLILSDLGLLRRSSGLTQSWRAWLMEARLNRCRCVALAPVAADDVDAALTALVRVLRWSPDSRWVPERGRPIDADASGERACEPDALHELLACLAATLRMDPPLLRALRQHCTAPQDASLEGRLWTHPDVRSTNYAVLRQHASVSASAPDRSLWSALHDLAAEHHAHWPLGMKLVDAMQQLAATPETLPALLDATRDTLKSLADDLNSAHGDRAMLVATAKYVLSRIPAQAQSLLGSTLDALAQAIGHPVGPRQDWCLRQRGDRHYIAPAGDARPPGPGVVLCSDLGRAASGELVRIVLPQRSLQYLPLPAKGELALPPLQHGAAIVLGGEETRVQRRRRTRGVWGWRQSDQGVVETLDLPWSRDLPFPNDGFLPRVTVLPSVDGADVAVVLGRDDYGVFLAMQPQSLLSRGLPKEMFLRFRYLEPGTFLQGSPTGIGDDDEHPQHPVTLTQGLWLAETPCTQALWQAVMGKMSSLFKAGEDAPQRPVENVSWDDVIAFLKTLQPLLPPGCEAVLPTESQWEYACRAGTQTEYWWGDDPDGTKANLDIEGNSSWEDKEGTTPVDRYLPNPWGLHDMHGNVWEWCADGTRDYAAEPARDPEGPGAGDSRVVRGGSWIFHPGNARAAYRHGRPRWSAYLPQGFRFALRSPVGPEARPGGPGARRGGAAGGRTDGADAPAAEPPRRARGKPPFFQGKDQDKDTSE